ncbi:ASCH domain-containing protein [Cetobacterium sp.]|uniref:ASCH domain-containing protein n=1 Tax=Cetobacterium sp. TaxID=2071632 RepID=UPI003F40FFF7
MEELNKILLSIKPKFVDKIFSGEKKYEFRRSIPKVKEIDTIIIYCSSPIKKIVGEIKVEKIIEGSIEKIWDITKEYSGIDKEYYLEYFNNKDKAYAFVIKEVNKYEIEKSLSDFGIKVPPQSFLYIKAK